MDVLEDRPVRRAKLLLTAVGLLLVAGVWIVVSQGPGNASSGTDLPGPDAAVAVGPRDAARAADRASRGGADGEGRMAEVLPTPIEREPAPPDPPPLEDFGEVVVQRPGVRLDGVASEEALAAVLGHGDVRFATIMRTATLAVPGADGQLHEVRVAAVDPRGFRVLAPQVTADSHALWQHLVDGAAVIDHDAAARLGAQLGGQLELPDRPPVGLGAIAALGSPSPADVVVSAATGERLGLGDSASLLVSLSEGARPSRVGGELAALVGAEATPLIEDRVVELGVTRVTADQWDDIWDRLAWCESSGRWHLDSGNGYYGGLQFLPESWWWVGGSGMPHEASREEQIARAKILLAYQGWEAWPACSRALGYR